MFRMSSGLMEIFDDEKLVMNYKMFMYSPTIMDVE
jgi:hypothetical protein